MLSVIPELAATDAGRSSLSASTVLGEQFRRGRAASTRCAALTSLLRQAFSFISRFLQSFDSMLGMQRRVLSSAPVVPRFACVGCETPNQAMEPTAHAVVPPRFHCL